MTLRTTRPAIVTRRLHIVAALALVFAAAGCATTAPMITPPQAPATVETAPLDRKVGWILRLEQQRVFRDPGVAATALPGPPDPAVPAAAVSQPAAAADLGSLMLDPDAAVRRRAALAIGRVKLPEGRPWLTRALSDPEEDVRAAAGFALGLLGSADAVPGLQAALADPSALVRANVIQGLGLIGLPAAPAASAIADASSGCAAHLAPIQPDDEEWPKTAEVEACRQALFALVRMRQYDALARVALDASGGPVSRWWPVAFALQRIDDARAVPALQALVSSNGVYTPAFALRGLAAAKDAGSTQTALTLATRADADVRLRVVAVRALSQMGGAAAVEPLTDLVFDPASAPNLALEAVAALGAIGDPRVFNDMVDLFTHPWPSMRLAAMTAAARVAPDGFLLVLSSLQPDREPAVRAGLAAVLSAMDAGKARLAIEQLAEEQDVRVAGPALAALAELGGPELPDRLFAALAAPDYVVRATAARLVGEQRPAGGAARLIAAYERADGDAAYDARGAILGALAQYGAAEAVPTLRRALDDREWPIRTRAAALLQKLGETAEPVRPVPLRRPPEFFESATLLHPPFSPHAFIETARGTVEIELNMVEAPVTSLMFIDLARSGFFNGVRVHRLVPNFVIQAGDPRGDGEGGPGYTIRDEFSRLPYLRGSVGMALAGPETGGSQFFITLSPQPHLDGQYTVFGRVVAGEDVLDLVQQWDVIDRVRIWDGATFR